MRGGVRKKGEGVTVEHGGDTHHGRVGDEAYPRQDVGFVHGGEGSPGLEAVGGWGGENGRDCNGPDDG